MSPQRPLLLVIATVHLDSQWRWTIRDTIRDFLPRTLAENFALFRSHPGYILSFEGAFRYMLAREYYPEAFAELAEWCARGRWAPAGAMLDAPDVNVVSPESLIRQILYGNDFFERELGVRSRDVFLPDCFGFSHALPSVAAHCGLASFSTSKLIKWKAPGVIPFDIGRWRGPDGAEILAVLRPGGYGEGIDDDLSKSAEWLTRLEALGRTCGRAVGVRYFGTGDRGGSPDRASLDRLEESIESSGPIEVRCSPSAAIQEALGPAEITRLPLHDSEILLPTHGTGCWTSQAALKRWNRKNELLAAAAERAAVVADWLGALDYPHERIYQGWLRFLWHQMHDDLPGTSIPAAYDITWNDQAVAANLLAGVLEDAVAAVAQRLDTTYADAGPRAQPLLVFNPSGLARQDVVELIVDGDSLPAAGPQVVSSQGRPLPTQVEPLDAGRVRVLFCAAVRPLSFTVFHLIAGGAVAADDVPEATPDSLENQRYRVEIDRNGDISSLWDKRLGRELLSGALRLELLRDRSHRWPAWEIRPETIIGTAGEPVRGELVAGPPQVRVVESGPVRAALRIERSFRGSRLVQTVRLARDGAGDRVEILNELDWATRGRLLKVAFPFAASSPLATYDLGLGAIERDNNTADRYEVPAQQWAEITDSSGQFGTAVLNDCLYGWDKPTDRELRLSLVRSPSSWRKYPHQRRQDHGHHRSVYALVGHAGPADLAELSRQAERLNQPLLAFAVDPSAGSMGSELAFLERAGGDVSVAALKKAEHGRDYVLRLRELARRPQTVRLELCAPALRAKRLRGDERFLADLPGGRSLDVDLAAWSVETLAFDPAPPPTGTAADLEPPRYVEIALPFDQRATSLHDDPTPINFDGGGASLPGELFPEVIETAGMKLDLGPSNGRNVLCCAGQMLELPAGQDHLWLIATCAGEAETIDLRFDDATRRLTVASWTGELARRPRPARWRGLLAGRPGRLVTDSLAWLGTHRHRQVLDGGVVEDEPYAFCYLFRYLIELPPGARRLRLPRSSQVRIFAAAVTAGHGMRPRALQPLYGG